jgi:hypothetical protein
MWKEREQLYAAIVGGFTCVLITVTFLVPWYSIDYYWQGAFSYRVEYSLGFEEYSGLEDMSRLMSGLTVILSVSLIATISAVVLPLLDRTRSGAIVGSLSSGLLVASAMIFYAGVIEAGPLDYFSGYTQLNRSQSVQTSAMIGAWVLTAAIVSQTIQVAFLAYLIKKKGRENLSLVRSREKRP